MLKLLPRCSRTPVWRSFSPSRSLHVAQSPSTESQGRPGPVSANELVERKTLRPSEKFDGLVSRGVLREDSSQRNVAETMDNFLIQLSKYEEEMRVYQKIMSEWTADRQRRKAQLLKEEGEQLNQGNYLTNLSRWFSRPRNQLPEKSSGQLVAHIKRNRQLDAAMSPRPVLPHPPKGLYLHGNVGTGKTMMMDILYEASEGVVRRRRRMHFNAAMLEMHQLMHQDWQRCRLASRHPNQIEEITEVEAGLLERVGNALMGESVQGNGAALLCFDEMQVVDMFTAVSLAGVLGALMQQGVLLVATSNKAPHLLNKDGLQNVLFDRFCTQLEAQCQVLSMATSTDYRRLAFSTQSQNKAPLFLWPLNAATERQLNKLWREVAEPLGHPKCPPANIPVMFGRRLEVVERSQNVARFTFEDLCNRPLGAPDYMALAQHFHTLFISGIPVMSMKISDQARRFITLVDELYNQRCWLICSAAGPPEQLFLGTEDGALLDLESLQFETGIENSRLRRNVMSAGGVAPVGTSLDQRSALDAQLSGRQEQFAFRRAVSRLMEMQTPSYLQSRPRSGLERLKSGASDGLPFF